jgi:hypothetical protein
MSDFLYQGMDAPHPSTPCISSKVFGYQLDSARRGAYHYLSAVIGVNIGFYDKISRVTTFLENGFPWGWDFGTSRKKAEA